MRLSMNSMRHTLFPKLVLALLAVVAPLYLLGLSINRLLESSVQKELTYSLESRIGYYVNSLEVERTHIMHLLQNFALDKDVQRLSFQSKYMTLYEWSETVMRIQGKLLMIQNSSPYLRTVNAHLVTIDRTLTSGTPIHERILEDYEAVKREDLITEQQGFVYWNDRMFLRFAYPETIVPQEEPLFVIGAELDKDSLRRTLQRFALYPDSGALLYEPVQRIELANKSDDAAIPDLDAYLDGKFAAGDNKGVESLVIGDRMHIVAYLYSQTLGSYLVMYIPRNEVFGTIESYRIYYWLLSLVALVVIVLYSYWLYRLLHKPLLRLVQSFRRVENGQMDPAALPRSEDEFRYLFTQYNRMIEQVRVLIHQVYEQKLRAQSSELKQLQSQINPHFLYNTYFILHRLVDMDDRSSALSFSRYLGEYFQYITRNAAAAVPLESEYQHSKIYAAIQNVRFSDRIAAEFGPLPAACVSVPVPKLILQPVIENAYKYGLERKSGGGRLRVAVLCDEHTLRITVEDNGEQLTDETLCALQAELAAVAPDVEHTGLLNVHRRLQIGGTDGGIAVERSELGGLKVTLRIGRSVGGEARIRAGESRHER